MKTDLREDPRFRRAEELTAARLRPGSGEVVSVADLSASPDGRRAAAAAGVCDALEGVLLRDGTARTCLAVIDLDTGAIDVRTDGAGVDTAPVWSPDGSTIGYLSDRDEAGVTRLRLQAGDGTADRATPEVAGFVESAAWSPDGGRILLGVAGFGSDLAGVQGAVAVERGGEQPSWMPEVEGAAEAEPWRGIWILDVAADVVRPVELPGVNIWSAAWCGPDQVAAICSDRPREGDWYDADVRLIDLTTTAIRTVYRPGDQIGCLAATPTGDTIAVVEAVCSDRDLVGGDLRLIDVATESVRSADSLGTDVVEIVWRGDRQLAFAGLRGADTVAGLLDLDAEASGAPVARELWRGTERTLSGFVTPRIAALGADPADLLVSIESFFEVPTVVALEGGHERAVLSCTTAETAGEIARLGTARDFAWTASDGLELHGWLVTPRTPGPHPVIVQVHGGPIMTCPPTYVGRSALARLALEEGYALFQPNVRGSMGLGQDASRSLVGDVGGADARDHLEALDALTAEGLIDPDRIGVTGGSYGGYMTAWLITQDPRFAAAVPLAPSSNWVSDRFTSNALGFFDVFLGTEPSDPAGSHLTRSPVHHATEVRTPTMTVHGELDRITHYAQGLELHRALQEQGVESLLVSYPEEGHGVRSMPAYFDFVARTIGWFATHMPADRHPHREVSGP